MMAPFRRPFWTEENPWFDRFTWTNMESSVIGHLFDIKFRTRGILRFRALLYNSLSCQSIEVATLDHCELQYLWGPNESRAIDRSVHYQMVSRHWIPSFSRNDRVCEDFDEWMLNVGRLTRRFVTLSFTRMLLDVLFFMSDWCFTSLIIRGSAHRWNSVGSFLSNTSSLPDLKMKGDHSSISDRFHSWQRKRMRRIFWTGVVTSSLISGNASSDFRWSWCNENNLLSALCFVNRCYQLSKAIIVMHWISFRFPSLISVVWSVLNVSSLFSCLINWDCRLDRSACFSR